MAYDLALAERIRKRLGGKPGLSEKKMFGGIGFLLNGNMCCGVLGKEMIVRLDPAEAESALKKAETRVFDFSGRPMKGWLFVRGKNVSTDDGLKGWVKMAVAYAGSLPAK